MDKHTQKLEAENKRLRANWKNLKGYIDYCIGYTNGRYNLHPDHDKVVAVLAQIKKAVKDLERGGVDAE